jgi:hypothetical protein
MSANPKPAYRGCVGADDVGEPSTCLSRMRQNVQSAGGSILRFCDCKRPQGSYALLPSLAVVVRVRGHRPLLHAFRWRVA